MLEAPKQDWKLYEAKCREEHNQWLRGLTPSAGLSLFENMRRLAASHVPESPDRERLEAARWQEKLAIRRKLLAVFATMDRRRE
jgi:hypothetical protein